MTKFVKEILNLSQETFLKENFANLSWNNMLTIYEVDSIDRIFCLLPTLTTLCGYMYVAKDIIEWGTDTWPLPIHLTTASIRVSCGCERRQLPFHVRFVPQRRYGSVVLQVSQIHIFLELRLYSCQERSILSLKYISWVIRSLNFVCFWAES